MAFKTMRLRYVKGLDFAPRVKNKLQPIEKYSAAYERLNNNRPFIAVPFNLSKKMFVFYHNCEHCIFAFFIKNGLTFSC